MGSKEAERTILAKVTHGTSTLLMTQYYPLLFYSCYLDPSLLCQPSDSVDDFSVSSLSFHPLYLTMYAHIPCQKGYDWYSYLIRASLSKHSSKARPLQKD